MSVEPSLIFYPGDKVEKTSGHEYVGTVVAAFRTMDGKPRYVVESTTSGARGLLFIFRDDQLRRRA